MSIASDRPIHKIAEDQFGRGQFAIRIAKVLASLEAQSSIVISVNGPWGEGKTSVLNMIEETLRRESKTLVIRFNPWRYADEDQLLRKYFSTLANELGRSLTRGKELAKTIKAYSDAITPLAEVVVPLIGKPLGETIKAITGRAAEATDLDALKKSIEKYLTAEEKRIIVFMDDIDRLNRQEIQAVFRLVKLTADFPWISYLLAFDEEKVAAALAEQFAGLEGGRSFLEKIVQVPLSVPPADPQILRKIAFEGVESALHLGEVELHPEDARLFVTVFDKAFLRMLSSPRAVKRYINMLNFAIPILKDEANILDLIILEGIRAFFPRLYSGMRDAPDILLQDSIEFHLSFNKEEGKGKFEELTKAAFDGLTNQEAEGALFALQMLFPKIAKYGVTTADYYVRREYGSENREQRISASRYFRRYFNYGVPPNDISDKEIEKLIAHLNQVSIEQTMSELEAFASGNRSEILIQKLREYEDQLSPAQAERLAVAIARKSELIPEGHPDNNIFGYGALPNAARLLRMLLHRIDEPTSRDEIARQVANDIVSLPLAYEYRWRVRKLKKETGSEELVAVVSDECEEEIARIIAGKFAKAAESVPLEDSHPLYKRSFYIQWRWGNLDSLRSYAMANLARNPIYISKFLDALLGIGKMDDSDSYSSFDPNDDYDFITAILAPDLIMEYIRQAFPNDLQPAPPGLRWFIRMYEQRENKKQEREEIIQESDSAL